jgi:hypothetical protein
LIATCLAYLRFLGGLPGFLNAPFSVEDARRLIGARLADRKGAFLRFVRVCIWGDAQSPYRRLLEHTGWDSDRLEAELAGRDLEDVLDELARDGVRLSFREFKGRQAIRREGLDLQTRSGDLDNRCVHAGCPVQSGGSTGRGRRTAMDLEFLAVRASLDRIAFRALGLEGAPLALWYPALPAVSGFGNSLRCAKAGQPPDRWFAIPTGSRNLPNALATLSGVAASRLSKTPLPGPEPVALQDLDRILDWMLGALDQHGRCIVRTYVSRAVRLAQRACERDERLAGACFMVGSEPLTTTRSDEITRSGARVFPRYGCTELGSIGVACADPAAPGDMHLASDVVAMTQPPANAGEERPLRFTSLLTCAPKVMLNAELGDCGVAVSRKCGCPFGELGLDTHLLSVHSVEKVSTEGMTVAVADLVRIIEEAMCPQFGGSPLHYQWVEAHTSAGLNGLRLRVAPEVGELDTARVSEAALAEVSRRGIGGNLASVIWAASGALEVTRETPRSTAFGKLLPFVRE